MKLPYQPAFLDNVPVEVKRTLFYMWGEIAKAHNSSVQPRLVTLTGNPPTVPPEMQQYELIALDCPDWGHKYLVYFDGVVRWYFETTGADLI